MISLKTMKIHNITFEYWWNRSSGVCFTETHYESTFPHRCSVVFTERYTVKILSRNGTLKISFCINTTFLLTQLCNFRNFWLEIVWLLLPSSFKPWRWRQHIPPKCWHPPTILQHRSELETSLNKLLQINVTHSHNPDKSNMNTLVKLKTQDFRRSFHQW
jgi:hypothetical protein